MMTVITHITLKEGPEPEWDAAMRGRLANARSRRGWVRGQILMPLDALNKRVIIGTWQSRADWEAWHEDPAFAATREHLDGLEAETSAPGWYEVVADVTTPARMNALRDVAAKAWETTTKLARRIRKSQ